MANDGALLRQYSQSGSEEAFGELVRKHLDLVYSTALRTLAGDEHLARDVSQTVFIDLARKAASLCRRPELAGWLYTSTCFAAANAVRSERRRQAREQAAELMTESASAAENADWDRIRQVLDSSMLELKETDREALLLRFFQRRSLAEMAQKLGLNENAARMRVERALERLRGLLHRRGIGFGHDTAGSHCCSGRPRGSHHGRLFGRGGRHEHCFNFKPDYSNENQNDCCRNLDCRWRDLSGAAARNQRAVGG
jgi:RNA polymerase sigma factor (sigma-70 family)